MKKIFLILITSLTIFFPAFSQQIRSFTPDSVIYIQEVEKFNENYLKEIDQLTLVDFISHWNSAEFSKEDREEIIQISNLLLKKNGRPSPHFINYYEAMSIVFKRRIRRSEYTRMETVTEIFS